MLYSARCRQLAPYGNDNKTKSRVKCEIVGQCLCIYIYINSVAVAAVENRSFIKIFPTERENTNVSSPLASLKKTRK